MRVRSQRLLLGLCLAAGITRTAPALSQVPEKWEVSEPPAAFVFGNAECPDPKSVQQSVLSLIPPERHLLLKRGVRVELEDLGESYRVTVWKDGASVKKSYSDPARECDGRARFAAVFTVLTLMPPELGAEPIAKPEPAPEPEPTVTPAKKPAPPPTPPPAPEGPPLARIELSALYTFAPAILEAPDLHSFGAELRVALGRGAVSGTLSLAYLQRAQFELNGVQGDVMRLPLSIGVRWRADYDSWTLATDLGLSLVPQRVRASNLLSDQSDTSVDVGARAGVQVARKIGPHFAPFFGAFAWFSPAPSEISALPLGVIGNLPYLWLGGAVGVSFGL